MDRRAFLRASGVALGTISAAGCVSAPSQGDEQPSPPPTDTETSTPTKTVSPRPSSTGDERTVLMVTEGSEYFFDPIGLFVQPGETVTWEIRNDLHSSTAYKKGNGPAETTRIPEDADTWNSDILQEKGATFQHTFEVEGTYDYFCIPHKTLGMVGRLVVGEPGGPAEGSMPPDGSVPTSEKIVNQKAVPFSEFNG